MPDANHIGIRRIVPFNHSKVLEDHERRALPARRQQDRRAAIVWHGRAVHAHHAQLRPLAGALLGLAVGQRIVKATRQLHFNAPGLPFDPAKARQISSSRGQRITWIIRPNVTLAVASEIHRVSQIRGWDKLRVSHRTRPRSGHIARRSIAVLQNLERGHQLLLKKPATPPVISQRREALDHIVAALETAIGALQPPNGHDNFFVDTVFGFDRLQLAAMFAQRRFAVLHPRIRRGTVQIFPDRLGELGLVAIPFDHIRIITHPAKGTIKGAGTDTLRQGTAPKPFDPTLKPRIGGGFLHNRRGRFGNGQRAQLWPQDRSRRGRRQ
mmetsp:Transcript_22340/g.35703  ORF Transcript_22340/g.35703 Transcript_22340/m.35703 type:complete len:325 (+) Transcript_22340:2142-3116(+)